MIRIFDNPFRRILGQSMVRMETEWRAKSDVELCLCNGPRNFPRLLPLGHNGLHVDMRATAYKWANI
jgi:hypothetical protein